MKLKTNIVRGVILCAAFSPALLSAKSAKDSTVTDPNKTAAATAGAAAPASNDGWEVTGAAGLSLADGNAQSISYSMQLLASRITKEDEIYLAGDYFYAKDKGIESTDSLHFSGQYNRLVTDRFYYGGVADFLTDNVADLDYRFSLNSVLGYYVLKDDVMSLAYEAGPGYTWESQGGADDDYADLRLAEKFEYRFSSRSKFWQSVVYAPQINEFDNYTLTAEVGIDTLITNQWSLRTFVRQQVDNTPAPGFKKGDTTVMVGLAYALAGIPAPAEPGRRSLMPATEAPPPAAMGWTTTAAAGYALAKGNSDNSSLTGSINTAYRTPTDEFFLNGAATYSTTDGETGINNILAAAQYNHLLGGKWFVGAGSGYQRDVIADLSYRFTPAVVGGYYFVKKEDLTFSLEAGPGYTFEKVADATDNYFAVQAAERLIWAFSPRCSINQSTVYNAEAADLDNFTLTSTAALDTNVTGNLAFRVGAVYTYDNTPAAGTERHDTTLISGIAVRF